jgi:hypothetical protein
MINEMRKSYNDLLYGAADGDAVQVQALRGMNVDDTFLFVEAWEQKISKRKTEKLQRNGRR